MTVDRAVSGAVAAPPEVALPALMFFNEVEAATVDAVAARIIPGDVESPGAREAGVVVYVDGALAGYSTDLQQLYRRALRELDRLTRARFGRPFRALDEGEQDAVLRDLDREPSGPRAGAEVVDEAHLLVRFFRVVREHTIEGMFCDPAYGGNRDAVGWKLIGFPGAQWEYSAEQMRPGFDAATIPVSTLADLRARRRSDRANRDPERDG